MRDSDLEKAFHQWLAEQRSERKRTRFPADSSALLKRLINARVLPYLDLKILSTHFRKKITYKDISQILFDNNPNYDAENVRKTVKELADKALDPLFLIHLLKI